MTSSRVTATISSMGRPSLCAGTSRVCSVSNGRSMDARRACEHKAVNMPRYTRLRAHHFACCFMLRYQWGMGS